MYKKCLWIIAFAMAFILNQTAFADASWCEKGLKEMVASLKLDDSQKAKVKPILDKLAVRVKQNAMQMKEVEQQIVQQVDAAKIDEAQIDELVDQKIKLIGNIIKSKIEAKIQIMAVLHESQKAEINAMIKKVEDDMAARFQGCHSKK